LIRKARNILATAGSVAILAGGMALAGAGAASAQTLPSCLNSINCASNLAGAAGYNGADDSHTHYRYVSTETTAAPGLINLNGGNAVDGSQAGTTGVTLCDENTGQVAQLALGYFTLAPATTPAYHLAYGVGHYQLGAAEPCVQSAGLAKINIFRSGFLLNFTGINGGDKLVLSIAYTGGRHPSIKFGVFDLTSPSGGVFRSATLNTRPKSFTEFGIGATSRNTQLTAVIPGLGVAAFLGNQVACYSCGSNVPITSVSPVNPFNTGGLYESQLVNISGDPIMSPLDSLAVSTDAFGIQNGSYISNS